MNDLDLHAAKRTTAHTLCHRANRRPPTLPAVAAVATMAAASLGLIAGCGDDSGDRSRFEIDVDGVQDEDQVGNLTDAELEAICGEYSSYLRTAVSFDELAYVGCLPAAIVLSNGDSDRCLEMLSECTDAFPDPIELNLSTGREVSCVENLRRCEEQVVSLEGCVNVNLDLLLDILSNWSCGNDDGDQIAEAAALMDSISICADSCDFGGLPQGPI